MSHNAKTMIESALKKVKSAQRALMVGNKDPESKIAGSKWHLKLVPQMLLSVIQEMEDDTLVCGPRPTIYVTQNGNSGVIALRGVDGTCIERLTIPGWMELRGKELTKYLVDMKQKYACIHGTSAGIQVSYGPDPWDEDNTNNRASSPQEVTQ